MLFFLSIIPFSSSQSYIIEKTQVAFDLRREMMAFVDRIYTIYLSCPYNFSCITIYTADDFHGKLGHPNLLIQKLLGPFLICLLCCEIYNL